MTTASQALGRLREGNARFASNRSQLAALLGGAKRAELALGQQPFAIILGCADSRVPAEIIFDQGLGSKNLRAIVDRIRPAVEELVAANPRVAVDQLLHQAVRANVRATANHLRHGSRLLEQLIQGEGLVVVGAEYSLATGLVEFFDGVGPE